MTAARSPHARTRRRATVREAVAEIATAFRLLGIHKCGCPGCKAAIPALRTLARMAREER
jgi:hypothetical protein